MYTRWNDTNHWFEKDTSAQQDGSGPWVKLSVDGSQIGQGNLEISTFPKSGTWLINSELVINANSIYDAFILDILPTNAIAVGVGQPTPQAALDCLTLHASSAYFDSSNLITSWSNQGYDTLTSAGANITSAITAVGNARANSNYFILASGNDYVLTITLTLNSGSLPQVYWNGATFIETLSNGVNIIRFTATVNNNYITFFNSTASNYSAVITLVPIASLVTQGIDNRDAIHILGSTTISKSFGCYIQAGTNTSDYALLICNSNGSTNYINVLGDGGLVIGSPTGGSKGLGTINATGLYVNGVAVSGSGGGITSSCIVNHIPYANSSSNITTSPLYTDNINISIGSITPATYTGRALNYIYSNVTDNTAGKSANLWMHLGPESSSPSTPAAHDVVMQYMYGDSTNFTSGTGVWGINIVLVSAPSPSPKVGLCGIEVDIENSYGSPSTIPFQTALDGITSVMGPGGFDGTAAFACTMNNASDYRFLYGYWVSGVRNSSFRADNISNGWGIKDPQIVLEDVTNAPTLIKSTIGSHSSYIFNIGGTFGINAGSFNTFGAGNTDITSNNDGVIRLSYIGASNPNTMIAFYHGVTVQGSITCGSGTTSYNTASDRRIKTKINKLVNALEIINKLNPITYEFIKFPNQIKTGFIADEVENILPEIVFGKNGAVDSNGSIIPQMLDLSKFVPLIVAAIQELANEYSSRNK